jgi:biopolymer transport protein ExbD
MLKFIGRKFEKSKNLSFVLDKDKKLYLDGKLISFDLIKSKIEEHRNEILLDGSSTSKLQALIAADELTPHGAVIKLIDSVRSNGINEFAINVEKTVSTK